MLCHMMEWNLSGVVMSFNSVLCHLQMQILCSNLINIKSVEQNMILSWGWINRNPQTFINFPSPQRPWRKVEILCSREFGKCSL